MSLTLRTRRGRIRTPSLSLPVARCPGPLEKTGQAGLETARPAQAPEARRRCGSVTSLGYWHGPGPGGCRSGSNPWHRRSRGVTVIGVTTDYDDWHGRRRIRSTPRPWRDSVL